MKPKIVIATISWARNKKEAKIILKTLVELNKLGLPVVLTDDSQSKFPLFDKAKKLKNFRVFKASGLDAKVKKSFSEASRLGQFIFYTESDKLEFIRDSAQLFLDTFLKNPKGIWLAARLPMNFKRLPVYQEEMERFLGDSFSALTNVPNEDISYGPRIFPSSLVKYLLAVQSPIQWGWQAYLLIISHRLHLPIRIIKLNTVSPVDVQKNRDLILFRMEQVIDSLRGFQLGLDAKL